MFALTAGSARSAWPILALAATLRASLALLRPLQVDEAYSLHVAGLPLQQGLQILRTLDVHPPLFLLLLKESLALHVGAAAIRLIMALCGSLSVWLLYAVVRVWHGERPALIAAGCAALMPSLIFYDSMIRMYAPFDTLVLLSFWILTFLLKRKDLVPGRRRLLWLAWCLVTTLLWYTLYLGILMTASQLLYIILVRRNALIRALVGTGCAALLFAPQLSAFREQLPRGGLAFPFYAQHQLQALWELSGQATLAPQTHGNDFWAGLASLTAWCWLVIGFALAAKGSVKSIVMWLGAAPLLTLVYSVLSHKLLYTDRYYLLLAYGLCAWTGLAATRIAQKIQPAARRPLALTTAGILTVCGFLYTFDPDLYTANWPAVATLLQSHSQPSDMIVFVQGSPFFVLERGTSLGHHPLLVVLRRADVGSSISLTRPFRRVWLVLFQAGPIDPGNAMLAALNSRRRVAGLWSFRRALPAENATVVFLQR